MSNIWCLRFNKPVKYDDVSVEDFEQRLVSCFIRDGWSDVVMVRELGDTGENPHWHVQVSNDYTSISALRKHLNVHYDVYGNEEFSIKAYDPNKAAAWKRYLAKGPLGKRLVMPHVVVDDLGHCWETLHHAYHDEACRLEGRRRKQGDGTTKMSCMDRWLALVRLKMSEGVVLHKNALYDLWLEFFRGSPYAVDQYIIDRFLHTAYLIVDHNGASADGMRHKLKFFEGSV